MSEIDTNDITEFKRLSIPLVRRIYPQLIANKIISVQPLTAPSSLAYYMRFQYSSRKNKGINNDGWTTKPKKKKIWRDITDPWEVSNGTME